MKKAVWSIFFLVPAALAIADQSMNQAEDVSPFAYRDNGLPSRASQAKIIDERIQAYPKMQALWQDIRNPGIQVNPLEQVVLAYNEPIFNALKFLAFLHSSPQWQNAQVFLEKVVQLLQLMETTPLQQEEQAILEINVEGFTRPYNLAPSDWDELLLYAELQHS